MSEILLGKKTEYKNKYSPEILCPIPRKDAREKFEINAKFFGYDIWNCYEIYWLDPKGKPQVRIAEIIIPIDSENIIESKSLKLYLFSLMNERFKSSDEFAKIVKQDLQKNLECEIILKLWKIEDYEKSKLSKFNGTCIDDLDVEYLEEKIEQETKNHQIDNSNNIIKIDNTTKSRQEIYSNLLKSNCLITSQPDFASIYINYEGDKIDNKSLLKYIISFKDEDMFHEHCTEKIFQDILKRANCTNLTIYTRYTRRGGIDINPIRSLEKIKNPEELNIRLPRQ